MEDLALSHLEKLPWRLSPSRASDFAKCPLKFKFGTIDRLRGPATPEQLRGTLAHEALERLFSHPRGQRTVDVALSYIDPVWKELRAQPDVAPIVERGPEAENEIIEYARKMVSNYFRMENPDVFEPKGVEIHLAADVAGAPLHGIIDRLDRVVAPDGQVRWYISDYKTGKVPRPNDQFMDEKFFAMKAYAVLAKEMLGIDTYELRLIYLAGGRKETVYSLKVTEQLIENTTKKIKALWSGIVEAAKKEEWEPRVHKLCDWCDFQEICPAWHPELEGLEVSDLLEHTQETEVSLRQLP